MGDTAMGRQCGMCNANTCRSLETHALPFEWVGRSMEAPHYTHCAHTAKNTLSGTCQQVGKALVILPRTRCPFGRPKVHAPYTRRRNPPPPPNRLPTVELDHEPELSCQSLEALSCLFTDQPIPTKASTVASTNNAKDYVRKREGGRLPPAPLPSYTEARSSQIRCSRATTMKCTLIDSCSAKVVEGRAQPRRYVPTRWVLTLFLGFLNLWSDVPKFRSLGGHDGRGPCVQGHCARGPAAQGCCLQGQCIHFQPPLTPI